MTYRHTTISTLLNPASHRHGTAITTVTDTETGTILHQSAKLYRRPADASELSTMFIANNRQALDLYNDFCCGLNPMMRKRIANICFH